MTNYDFIVIGGGVSGLSAAMYATRLGLSTLTFAKMPGGLITTTHLVENWPGIKQISGPDLAMSIYDHAKSVNAEIKNEQVLSVTKENELFKIQTSSGEYLAKAVLFSTGSEHRKLGVPGEKEFENKGVSYCALCDGAFYKNKQVAIVGGGDSAVKEALLLSQYATKVFIIVRKDTLRCEPTNNEKLKNSGEKIEVLYNSEIAEILGSAKVEKIRLKDGREMNMDGVFVAVGHLPQTDLAKNLGVELNSKGEIMVNRRAETNLPGVYAAGDCDDSEFKQAITGSAEAVTASYYAYHYCNKGGNY